MKELGFFFGDFMAKYQLFADEAWTHNSPPLCRYHYFFGGIFGTESAMDRLDYELKLIVKKHNVKSEIKWNKVSPNHKDCYKELVDCLVDNILSDKIKYRQMFKDRSYHYDNPENYSELDMQFRLYYQFLKNSFGFQFLPVNGQSEILLRLDGHSSQKHKDELDKFVLDLPRLWGRNDITFRVTYIESDKFIRLQVCDLLMGAAGYKGNKIHHRRENNKRGMTKKQKLKIELADYIYNKLRKINEIDRGSKAFNWFESTGLNANTENRFHHKMRIWKFIPNSYRKNKGWENDNLTKEGYFVKDIFETEVLQGNEEG